MNQDLPEFELRTMQQVLPYARSVFGDSLVSLQPYEDGHFRAIFHKGHFTIQEGATEPTKSQWNTLKKQMKRRNRGVFIFKEHGKIDCEADVDCYYIDFGFFLYRE
jgi:hypothetical protein